MTTLGRTPTRAALLARGLRLEYATLGWNAVAGWWWADPLAGLAIVYYGLREGRAAWREET
jgi:hypothetical protein